MAIVWKTDFKNSILEAVKNVFVYHKCSSILKCILLVLFKVKSNVGLQYTDLFFEIKKVYIS